MEKTTVLRLAKMLMKLVGAVLAVNLLCLLLVPGAVAYLADGGPQALCDALRGEVEMWLGQGEERFPMLLVCLVSWWVVWHYAETALLTLFFWVCGICTALILWQARLVLATILEGSPFQVANAVSMRRAAVCCWVISGAALLRLLVWLWWAGGLAPLFTYNTLFIPAFFMAGLLLLVMSALFAQAAQLREDQELTI